MPPSPFLIDALRARAHPSQTAPLFTFLEKETTAFQLMRAADQMAAGMEALGFSRDIKIGVCLPNTPYLLIAVLGLMRMGQTVFILSPDDSEENLRTHIIKHQIEIVITWDVRHLYAKLIGMIGETTLKRLVMCSLPACLSWPERIVFKLLRQSELMGWNGDFIHISWDEILLQGCANLARNDAQPRENSNLWCEQESRLVFTKTDKLFSYDDLSAKARDAASTYLSSFSAEAKILFEGTLAHPCYFLIALGALAYSHHTLKLVPKNSGAKQFNAKQQNAPYVAILSEPHVRFLLKNSVLSRNIAPLGTHWIVDPALYENEEVAQFPALSTVSGMRLINTHDMEHTKEKHNPLDADLLKN